MRLGLRLSTSQMFRNENVSSISSLNSQLSTSVKRRPGHTGRRLPHRRRLPGAERLTDAARAQVEHVADVPERKRIVDIFAEQPAFHFRKAPAADENLRAVAADRLVEHREEKALFGLQVPFACERLPVLRRQRCVLLK